MIGCDGGCDDWFHGKCVGIEERNKGLIDRYMCPNCEKKGLGHTTWKRMCRRGGCRMPARVGGKKNKGEPASKYCSDECGLQYMREQVAKTRGSEDAGSKGRARKKSVADTVKGFDEDLGSRGGALTTGELKALVNATSGIDDFKRLGDGVLSPPATPSPKTTKIVPNAERQEVVLNDGERERIAQIGESKNATRARHGLLKDRTKFITMLKQEATRIAVEKDMKPKEMCGYDSRIAWSEDKFNQWRSSRIGSEALRKATLDSKTDADGDDHMQGNTDTTNDSTPEDD